MKRQIQFLMLTGWLLPVSVALLFFGRWITEIVIPTLKGKNFDQLYDHHRLRYLDTTLACTILALVWMTAVVFECARKQINRAGVRGYGRSFQTGTTPPPHSPFRRAGDVSVGTLKSKVSRARKRLRVLDFAEQRPTGVLGWSRFGVASAPFFRKAPVPQSSSRIRPCTIGHSWLCPSKAARRIAKSPNETWHENGVFVHFSESATRKSSIKTRVKRMLRMVTND